MNLTREELIELIKKDMEKTMREYYRILTWDYYTVRRDLLGRVIKDEPTKMS